MESKKGIPHSKEHNLKVSMALKGRKKSKEHCANIKKSKEHIMGKTYEQIYGEDRAREIKRKLSIVNSGKNNNMYGKTHSVKARMNISKKNKGRVSPNKGKPCSDSAKKYLSDKFKGKHHSPDTEFKKGHKTWIEGKTHSEKTRKMLSERQMGEDNHNWKGGKSSELYGKDFNKKFKNIIRKRDNQICMLCNVHREKIKRALSVHHIDYNKLLSIKENCLCLCDSCHSKTHYNRKHWKTFFQSLLNEKYRYEYSESREIVINIDEGVSL